MKKEVLIAVVIGLFFGLIVTFGISTANKALTDQKQKKISDSRPSPLASGLNSQSKNLSITSHESFDLVDQSNLNLSGIAWPNAVIALLAENQSFLTQADNEGIFTFNFNLIKGFNEITIIGSDETGSTQTQNLVITYSTTKI